MTVETPKNVPTAKRKSLWRTIFKVFAWVAGIFVGLLLIIMCAVAWILTPERLTPLVEEYAGRYLKADVKAARVELTVWKSFPYVELDIDSLRITSRTLKGQPDSVINRLPADASRLLEADAIHGGVNPWHLLHNTLKLGDIDIKGLGINLVQYAPGVNNFDILPPSEKKGEEEPSSMRISLSDINILAQRGIRYFDASSGIDLNLSRPAIGVTTDADTLSLHFSTPVDFDMQGHKYLSRMPLSLNGNLLWQQVPMAFSSRALSLAAWGVSLNMAFDLDLGEEATLRSFSLDMPPVQIIPLLQLVIPEVMENTPELRQLSSDIALALKARTKAPWKFSSPALPDVEVLYNIPACRLTYGSGSDALNINNMHLSGNFLYTGARPESSSASVPVFAIRGEGIDLDLSLKAEELLGPDPLLTLSSRGHTDISRFRSLMPGTLMRGNLNADATVKCRLSDILHSRWQNIDADGSVQIRGLLFAIPLMATKISANLATLTFGNSLSSADAARGMVAGMLRAEADVDTIYCQVPGIAVSLSSLNLRAGTTPQLLAEHNASDVMPMGMCISAKRVVMDSETDTLHIAARNLEAGGSITRFEGNVKSPLLKTRVSADRVRYTDPFTRLGVRNLSGDMTAHLRPRKPQQKSNYQRRYDAIAKANPTLSADSVAKLASTPRRLPQGTTIDMSVDNGLKALIRQWGIEGGIQADRVNLTYIAYPVRTILSNLALDFSLDSIRLHRAYIRSQKNRMSLSGTVSNLRHTMLGRTRRPLQIRLFADIDSLDINQVAYNYELGTGLQARRGVLARINPEDEEALVKAAAELQNKEEEPRDTAPILIPRNLDAQIHLTAREALYTNLALHNLSGRLVVNDGAVSIDSLVTDTDFGSAYFNLLYSTRDINDLNLSVDLGFNRVRLSNFYTSFPTVVEMMPAITNLNGMVEASLTGSFNLYPNMDIDLNSVNAMLNINGSDLTLSQNPLIRKVARMMLIRKKGDLNISDMNIQVSLHDNILRLYPFAFSMDRYKFALLGENDLSENMYYHLSVLKSPIPWKFGINIKGTFTKPKLRFGGPKYKENQAREVVNLVKAERVNFVRAMRLQLHKLVGRAALNYADRHEPNEEAERRNQSMSESQYESPSDMLGGAIASPIAKILGKNANLLELNSKQQKENKKK